MPGSKVSQQNVTQITLALVSSLSCVSVAHAPGHPHDSSDEDPFFHYPTVRFWCSLVYCRHVQWWKLNIPTIGSPTHSDALCVDPFVLLFGLQWLLWAWTKHAYPCVSVVIWVGTNHCTLGTVHKICHFGDPGIWLSKLLKSLSLPIFPAFNFNDWLFTCPVSIPLSGATVTR